MTKKILIIGINGFIGNQLTKAILKEKDWEIYGCDINSNKINHSLDNKRLHFDHIDILSNEEWIHDHIKKCDVILPLAAIANPGVYVTDPLKVFELDFEANLKIVRKTIELNKYLIFPSTSEVYGMSSDKEFDEETSLLVQGPINKERWIYSCSKQLMDRIIYAYGKHKGAKFTLFRPFNWIGPTQDDVNVNALQKGGVRLIPQLISNIIRGNNFQLVDGGSQKRSFTYIDDGIEALIKIIENKNDCAHNKIFNIGNPKNIASIKEIANEVLKLAHNYPKHLNQVANIKIINTHSNTYYGEGYQDLQNRVPSIKRAIEVLNWHPRTSLQEALRKIMDFYLL